MDRHPWRKNVGRAIRERRRKMGLTLEEAAEAYGCVRRTWSNFEMGENLTLDVLHKIAGVLRTAAWRLMKA